MNNKIVVLALNPEGKLRMWEYQPQEASGATGQFKIITSERLLFIKTYVFGAYSQMTQNYTTAESIFGDCFYVPQWYDKIRAEDYRPLGDTFVVDYQIS